MQIHVVPLTSVRQYLLRHYHLKEIATSPQNTSVCQRKKCVPISVDREKEADRERERESEREIERDSERERERERERDRETGGICPCAFAEGHLTVGLTRAREGL